jgi:hypothetical protein
MTPQVDWLGLLHANGFGDRFQGFEPDSEERQRIARALLVCNISGDITLGAYRDFPSMLRWIAEENIQAET